jgi:hypothetical protein
MFNYETLDKTYPLVIKQKIYGATFCGIYHSPKGDTLMECLLLASSSNSSVRTLKWSSWI